MSEKITIFIDTETISEEELLLEEEEEEDGQEGQRL